MGNITLLELHVPEGDIQLGPKSLGRSQSESETPQAESTDPADPVDSADDSTGRSLGAILVAVGVIAVLVVMATKLLGEDADEEIAGFDESS